MKSRFRLLVKVVLIALAGILIIPPLQVVLTIFWNPTTSPMQWQRKIEGWLSHDETPRVPTVWVPLRDIPLSQIHYVWASEDQNFFKHGGFDFHEMRKAIEEARERGEGVRGASTISMQCARSVFLWQGRSYVRKALEFYYTFWMELLMSKQRILELYLNSIELGRGVYGIGTAAREHFGKTPAQLTKREMIALAAILPNPREWSPSRPDATVKQRMGRVERLAARAPFPAVELPSK